MAKKWPGMVVQRSFIKGHSFRNRLYKDLNYVPFSCTKLFQKTEHYQGIGGTLFKEIWYVSCRYTLEFRIVVNTFGTLFPTYQNL